MCIISTIETLIIYFCSCINTILKSFLYFFLFHLYKYFCFYNALMDLCIYDQPLYLIHYVSVLNNSHI